jgi:predicted N-acyltransferase
MNIEFIDNINQIPKEDWQQLTQSTCPLLNYEFFKALEDSHSVSHSQGWQAHHLTVKIDTKLVGILPLYIKQHSWGEYVFDWDWAQAFERHNLPYYPKLVSTIPFTPVPSQKLFSTEINQQALFRLLVEYCQQNQLNSWHLLFCPEEIEQLPKDVYLRHTVQFHWFNRDYQCFDDFIATFTARKRKNTRKERLSISQQDITVQRLLGKDITKKEVDYFYLIYQLTYLKNSHQPHLSHDFFNQIFSTLKDNVLLIIASYQEQYVACSLFFFDDSHLYGRYWGCSESFKNLHFELCYYQGIEFCIDKNLQCFNPGTQGEHKIQRGFEAVLTHSYHWIKHPSFKDPIKDFCLQEQKNLKHYQQQCIQELPFKNVTEQ